MLPISRKTLLAGLGALLLLAGTAPVARAQYNPYYPQPIYPGRAGGYLYGSAQVINSVGSLTIQQEQARIAREQANQAKLDTKRKAFDEMMYERANTPTFTQNQAKIKGMVLQRMLGQATDPEISSGKAQNVILPYLSALADQGVQGPPAPLDPQIVQQLNVTAGDGSSSLGLLKQTDHLEWPLVLRGPTQEKLAGLLPVATEAAAKGRLDPSLYGEVAKEVGQLKDDLKKRFYAEEIDGTAYLTGKRFLEGLDGAVTQLQQPGAGKFLSGAYAPRGRTVDELVKNMTQQGLRFAPATPGSEAAYRALYNAMVSYSTGAQTASGFRVEAAPPRPTAFQGGPR